MPYLFVVSDVHGFYDEMMEALENSGFDKYNPDHWLISCGDNWDRGTKPVEVTNFLDSLERKILIKGNHEDLFIKCCERMFPEIHDYHNGTYNTILYFGRTTSSIPYEEKCKLALDKTKSFLSKQINYFETKNYIFVHGFIPVICENLSNGYQRYKKYEYDPNWRNASEKDWEKARWLNGVDVINKGVVPDKTVVCGHWHCSYGHSIDDGTSEFGSDANFSPYYRKNIIALDACTAYSKKVNVVVLKDDFI